MRDAVVIIAPDMTQSGSVGSVAWRHAVELSRGFKVYVITRAVPAGGHGDIEPILVRPRTWPWLRRLCHVPNELSWLRAAGRALDDLGRRTAIRAVWCHSHGVAALVAAPACARLGSSVIMTTHGDIFDRPAGTYSPELTQFYRWVTPLAYRRSDLVHVLSPAMVAWAVKGGAAPANVRLMPNGVDPLDIGAAKLAPRSVDSFMPQGRLRLLYVGSLWNVKGVDVLIHAAAALKASSPSMKFSVTLVGGGTARQQLETLALGLGVAEHVVFKGRVPRNALAGVYLDADILCVPSLSETLSTATLEGMLCGLPVVASDTGGMPYLVEQNVSGYLAPSGDAGTLARQIALAASSREHLAALGARGFARARADFNWDDIGGKLLALAADATQLDPNRRAVA